MQSRAISGWSRMTCVNCFFFSILCDCKFDRRSRHINMFWVFMTREIQNRAGPMDHLSQGWGTFGLGMAMIPCRGMNSSIHLIASLTCTAFFHIIMWCLASPRLNVQLQLANSLHVSSRVAVSGSSLPRASTSCTSFSPIRSLWYIWQFSVYCTPFGYLNRPCHQFNKVAAL